MAITIPPMSEVGLKAGSTVAHTIAIGMTAARLHIRMKKGHIWWDDWLAASTAAMDVVYMLSLWLELLDPQYELDGIFYQNVWILYFPSFYVVWATRVSVWLSLARIYPPQHSTRRLALLLATVFSVLGVSYIAGVVLGCRGSNWGLRFQYDQCFTLQSLGRLSQFEKIVAVMIAVDLACHMVLVIVPAYLLSRMRRIERKRKLVVVILCCGSVLALFTLMLASIIVYGPFAETEGKVAIFDCLTHLSTAIALLSANLLVVGTAFYIRVEGWIIDRTSAQRVGALRRPMDSAANVTYNSDLTRISTSDPDFLSTSTDIDWEDHSRDNYDEQETRPLFWSLQVKDYEEDYELSVARRATV